MWSILVNIGQYRSNVVNVVKFGQQRSIVNGHLKKTDQPPGACLNTTEHRTTVREEFREEFYLEKSF